MEEMNENLSAQRAEKLRRMEEADKANEYLYLALDIGQYMLQCGGEVSRVEDSIRRMCIAFGAKRADVFTITSSIMATIYAHHFGSVSQTRRIKGMQYDLNRLEQLNQLSRRICAGEMGIDDTWKALDEIRNGPRYSFRLQIVAYALVSASFSVFFGGSWGDAVASGIVGVLLKCLDRMISKTEANALLSALICSCVGGLLAAVTVRLGLGESVEMISIGNIMLLIPGIALTNSLRDMFSGNTVSGILRFLEAVILAMVIAFGFALVASWV